MICMIDPLTVASHTIRQSRKYSQHADAAQHSTAQHSTAQHSTHHWEVRRPRVAQQRVSLERQEPAHGHVRMHHSRRFALPHILQPHRKTFSSVAPNLYGGCRWDRGYAISK